MRRPLDDHPVRRARRRRNLTIAAIVLAVGPMAMTAIDWAWGARGPALVRDAILNCVGITLAVGIGLLLRTGARPPGNRPGDPGPP